MSNDLAQRAVACKHWRWMPGMLTRSHGRLCGGGWLVWDDVDELGAPFVDCTSTIDEWPDATPDFTDPATLGALLALVRDAWEDPYMTTDYWRGPRVWTCKSDVVHSVGACRHAPRGDTEAEALIAALEAAP